MALDLVLVAVGGVPLVALAAGLAFIAGRRRDTMLLAAFLAVWGAGAILSGFRDPSAPETGLERTQQLRFLIDVVTAGFLLAFAAATTNRRSWRRIALGYLPLGVVAAALTIAGDGRLAFLLYTVSFPAAILAILLEQRRAPAGSGRHRLRGLVIALAIYPAYTAAYSVVTSGADALDPLRQPWGLAAAAMAAMLAFLVARPVQPEGRDWRLIGAFALPMAIALPALVVDLGAAGLAGVFRVATAALLAYAIARHHLFDIDLKLRHLVGPALAVLALAYGALGAVLRAQAGRGPFEPLLMGAGVALVAYALRREIGARLFPAAPGDAAYAKLRKLEVYRASLVAARASGLSDASSELARLRRSFGITTDEHDLLVAQVAAASATRTSQAGALVLGRYRIQRLLGEGAYGRTHLALDATSGTEVAVKRMPVERGGEREADILRRVKHPRVVELLDAGEEAEQTVLVLAYQPGGNLRGLLRRRGALPREDAVSLMDGVLAGLEACHAAGVVHADLKPENVLLDAEGAPSLADFGISREARLDATGLTMGGASTLLYMAPEQVRGRRPDARADLYAAAALFHEMLTGRHYLPIAGRDDFQIRSLIVAAPLELALPAALSDAEPFLRVGLQKDPERRFQTASEMRRALGGLAADGGASAHASPGPAAGGA